MTQKNSKQDSFSMLLASSVHDIKNILGSVLESVDWLRSTEDNLNEQQHLELEKVNRLVTMVNSELMQVLSIYKFENQQYVLSRQPVIVDDFADMQQAFMVPLLASKQIEFTTECDPDLTLEFDETLIASAVRNAAMNAMKFAKSRIHLSIKQQEEFIIIQVEDDGPGYPDDMLGSVENIKGNIDLNSGSTGLGLYFAEIVAELHNTKTHKGWVELGKSSLGGALFQIHIPDV